MKKLLFFAAGIVCLAACAERDAVEIVFSPAHLTIDAVNAAATRSSLDTDAKSVLWNVSEQIAVFYGNNALGSFTSSNESPSNQAVFVSDAVVETDVTTGNTFYGVYPYSSSASCSDGAITMPVDLKTQQGKAGSFGDKAFPSAASSASTKMTFKNLCGGVKFKVSATDVKTVTFTAASTSATIAADEVTFSFVDGLPVVNSVSGGSNSISLTLADGASFLPDTYYYITALPVELKGGFTMTFETATQVGSRTSTNDAVIERSVFGDLGVADDGVQYISSDVKNLSESATANCYIVVNPGMYKFSTMKGNSSVSVGDVKTAELLWETFNNDIKPNVGDIIQNVSYADGFITFKYTGTLGNAVIAAKDASGVILWSWHIWCSPVEAAEMEQVLAYRSADPNQWGVSTTVMDRNLGAISGTPGDVGFLGLMYQWGRKDPFPGAESIRSNELAKISVDRPEDIVSTSETGTIEYSIQNPMQFIARNHNNWDWFWTESGVYSDASRWGGNTWGNPKSRYDPCPPGYKVSFSNGKGEWICAMGGTSWPTEDALEYVDPTTLCIDATDILNASSPCYLPFAGFSFEDYYKLLGVGSQSLIATASSAYNDGLFLDFRNTGYFNAHTRNPKSNAYPVRCVKEK